MPDEAARLTISLQAQDEGRALVKLNWPRGFRPGAVKEVKQIKRLDEGGETDLRVTDEAGGSATITGPVEASIQDGQADPLDVAAGGRSRSFGSITGTVIDQDGRPIAGANVTIYHNYRQWGTISGSAMSTGADRRPGPVRPPLRPRGSLMRVIRRKLSIVVYKDGYAGRDTRHLRVQAAR